MPQQTRCHPTPDRRRDGICEAATHAASCGVEGQIHTRAYGTCLVRVRPGFENAKEGSEYTEACKKIDGETRREKGYGQDGSTPCWRRLCLVRTPPDSPCGGFVLAVGWKWDLEHNVGGPSQARRPCVAYTRQTHAYA
eukprot:TRINITY_DN502_c0_g1_i2.p4 TRINITY_DN502_c0_g1~~TRINITY_DN502_c0_g1_i2.p4  ORF type:complete len:138 (-),score=2.91 TRINITY_DN502_c0_g1_i2:697-1110(-)